MLRYTVLILVMVPYFYAQECSLDRPGDGDGDEFRPREVGVQPGSKWVLVKFKPPLCAIKLQIDYYRFIVTDLNSTKRFLVPNSKNIPPSCFESSEDFLLYNVSRGSDPCGQPFDIKPCTTYDKLQIRAFYNDSQIQSKVNGSFDQSVTTLPDLKEILQGPRVGKGPDWFRVSWKHPSCKDYVSSWLVTIVDQSKEPPRQQIPFEIPITAGMRRKDQIDLEVSSGMLKYTGGSSITNLQVAPFRQYRITIAPKYNTTDETGKGISVSVETDKRVIGAFEVTSVSEAEVSFTAEVDDQSQWLKLTDIRTQKYAWMKTPLANCQSAKTYKYACSHTIKGFLDNNYWWWGERTYISPCRPYKLSIGYYEDATLAFLTPPGLLGQLTVLVEKATEDSVELKIGLHEGCSLKLTAVRLSLFQNGNPTAIVDTKIDESCLGSASNQYQLTLGNRARCDSLKQISFQGCTKYYVTLLPELEGPCNGTVSNVSIVTEPRGSSANVHNITFKFYPTILELLQWNAPECTVSLHLTKYYVSLYRVRNETPSASASSAICSFQVGSHEFTTSEPILQIKLMEQCKTQLDSCSQYRVDIASSFEGLSANYSESYPFTTPPSFKDGKVRGLAVADVTQDSFKFYWENPLCGQPITFFRIAMNHGNNFIDVPSDISVSFAAPLTISNEGISHKQFNNSQWKPPKLKPCLNYTVYVTPHYQVYGPGQSESLTLATKAAEIQPLNVTVSDVAATSAVIQWNEDLNPQCILRYEVSILNDSPGHREGTKIEGTTKDTTYAVSGLIPGISYSVTVYAYLTSGSRKGRELSLSFVKETEPTSSEAVWIPIVIVTVVAAVVAVVVVLFPLLRRLKRRPVVTEVGMLERRPDLLEEAKTKRERPILLSQFMDIAAVYSVTDSPETKSEYQDLKRFSEENTQPKTVASLPENKSKNRYVNILPFDFNRVFLKNGESSEESDYINASFIAGLNGPYEYIAAQAPKEATLLDFWKMIWQQKVRLIVMLTLLHEKGKSKCEQYWPDRRVSASYGIVMVKHVHEEEFNGFISRQLEVTHEKTKRKITQLHYTKWPDFGCPSDPGELTSCVQTMRDRVAALGEVRAPILVHCSAGAGRTGTFIAIDMLTQGANTSEKIDVFKTVLKLRECRVQMVQTIDQYAFLYKCMAHYIRTKLQNQAQDGLDDGLVEISLA